MEQFEGKVAVVTGAASGIGLALSKAFADRGMRVAMADVEREALEAAAQQVGGDDVLPVVVDVADGEQVERLCEQTLSRFGAVHVLCNNAGVGGRARPLWKHTAKDFEWVLGVNLWGVVHGLRVFTPHLLRQNEGHIVNTASIAGLISMPNLAAYNASKQAVVALSETLLADLGAEGSQVGVSVLCPGAVNTRIHEADRNRPTALRDPASKMTEEQRKRGLEARARVGELLQAGLAPAAVAQQVVEAIKRNQFYILTHPELNPAIEQRLKSVLESVPGPAQH